jgi:sec-independent protein translocase protein TatC
VSLVRRKDASSFQRAASGEMTLLDHLNELRSRLFKASLGIVVGCIIGWIVAKYVQGILQAPYCDYTVRKAMEANGGVPVRCDLLMIEPTAGITLRVKIAMYVGLILSSPVWLFQLWAFIAPGLHKHERRWAYWFVGFAAPLFALGALLAYLVIGHGLEFLLSFAGDVHVSLEITRYFDFVSGLLLLFGLAFEFPLVVVLFNLAGIASYKRLLGWWRIAVFAFFAFSAIAIPTGDPFSMTALGIGLTAMYFGAVGFAYVNDKRRARKSRELYGDLADDEISTLDHDLDEVEASTPISPSETVTPSRPVTRSYDDAT